MGTKGFKIDAQIIKAEFKTLSEVGWEGSMKASSSKTLELEEQFLGKGYKEL